MRHPWWLLALLLGAMLPLAGAQEPDKPAPTVPAKPDPALVRLRAQVNPEFLPWSKAYVFERCAEHLATINRVDRPRIRYFDLSDVPRQYQTAGVSALFFGVNSSARIPVTLVPRAVPNTDNRLFWIDLCWYAWTPEVWEYLSKEDPYYREPLIPSASPGLNYIRTETQANAVLNVGWFLWYVFDNGEFINQKDFQIFNPNAFYYQLLYASVAGTQEVEEKYEEEVTNYETRKQQRTDGYRTWTEDVRTPVKKTVQRTRKVYKPGSAVPTTAAEFEKIWHVDFKALRDFPIDKGAMVDEGRSSVVFNNRILWRVRNALGVYWRTFDVFRSVGDQDFVENPFPKQFDAGEHIFQDERGAQYYLLTNGKGNAIDSANPFVVKGDPAGPHNTVLVTSRSCIHCHDSGILNFRNEHIILQRAGVDLRAITPDRAERFNQFYLQERKMKKLVTQDQENYTEFIKDCNGLTPQENLQNFQKFRAWYGRPINLAQAAREHGVSTRELEAALAIGVGTIDEPQGVTKGRLGRLVLDDVPVPRITWERGSYAESGLVLLEWVKRGRIGAGDGQRPMRWRRCGRAPMCWAC